MSYRSFARAVYGYGLALGFVMLSQRRNAPRGLIDQEPHHHYPWYTVSHRMLISSAINLLKHIMTIVRVPSTCTQACRLFLPRHIGVQAALPPTALTSQRSASSGIATGL